jgi:predicted ATP-binding protein involved in virulence
VAAAGGGEKKRKKKKKRRRRRRRKRKKERVFMVDVRINVSSNYRGFTVFFFAVLLTTPIATHSASNERTAVNNEPKKTRKEATVA